MQATMKISATSKLKSVIKKKNIHTLKPKSFSMVNKEIGAQSSLNSDINHEKHTVYNKQPYHYADKPIPGSLTQFISSEKVLPARPTYQRFKQVPVDYQTNFLNKRQSKSISSISAPKKHPVAENVRILLNQSQDFATT